MSVATIQTAHVNGQELAWLEQGEGPVVLCLHGFPDTAHTWSLLMPELAAAGFRAVALFMRGYPPSAPSPDGSYTALELGHDVLGLLDALDVPQADIVAHDWGVTAAYAAAHTEPGRVRRLVTSAIPHLRAVKPSLDFLRRSSHFLTLPLPGAPGRIRRDPAGYLKRLIAHWSPGWQVSDEELAPILRAWSEPGAIEAALGYYRSLVTGGLTARGRQSQRLLTRRTSVPTLAFAGAMDGALNARAFEATPEAFTGPYRYVVLDDAGHFLHRERAERFNREVLSYLGGEVV